MGGLLAVSPAWYFLPVCLIALIGGMSTGTTALVRHRPGLLQRFPPGFPASRRPSSSASIAIVFIFVGKFAFNVVQSISTFAVLIITCTAPWMIIMTVGYVVRRGWYDADSLQVFNRRQTGGRYWFNHGWNWRAMAVWIFAAVMGILFVNIPGQFIGPLGDLAAGVDLSIPVSIGLAAVLYPLCSGSSRSRPMPSGPPVRGSSGLQVPRMSRSLQRSRLAGSGRNQLILRPWHTTIQMACTAHRRWPGCWRSRGEPLSPKTRDCAQEQQLIAARQGASGHRCHSGFTAQPTAAAPHCQAASRHPGNVAHEHLPSTHDR